MRKLEDLEDDLATVIERMRETFPHLTFRPVRSETVGFEGDERRVRIFLTDSLGDASSRLLVIRAYGFGLQQDEKIFRLLEFLGSEDTLRRNHVSYEPVVQIASRFEVQYN